MILLTTEFAGATPLSRKAVELTGLPGAMDACGKPAQEDRFAPPGGLPTCVHNPLENAEAFSSAPWKTGSRETPKTVGLPRPVSHNPTASTTMRKNSTTTRKKGLTLHRGTKLGMRMASRTQLNRKEREERKGGAKGLFLILARPLVSGMGS